MKRKTLFQFIKEAESIHGKKYDYSKAVYKNIVTPIIIICPIHGEFLQKPTNHLRRKGCPICGKEKLKKATYGYNDIGCCSINKEESQSYKHWRSMNLRCYSKKYHERYPTYIGCTVCDEWKTHSGFKKWFDRNYIKGYSLDKDILIKGNKIYSPSTCCFVPVQINNIVIKRKKGRGELPIGVGYMNGRYRSFLHKTHLGMFDSPIEAFNAYKKAKEKEINEIANDYYEKGLITKRVYNALINHKVEITD